MKKSFKSFIIPTQENLETAWKSEKTVFIFDTNVLLNLYSYEENTREDFFKSLDKIKSKIWIPHHVGLEYHRRRLDVIKNEKKAFREISTDLEQLTSTFKEKLNKPSIHKKFPELSKHLKKLTTAIEREVSSCSKIISEWDQRQPDVRSNDEILNKIDSITENKIGSTPESQDWLNKIFKTGEERYKKKIPPGFKDANKAKGELEDITFMFDGLIYERQYGDLIIWEQIINEISLNQKQNVIFITDDTKSDWWQKVESGGAKIIGPNEHLKSEIYRRTEVELFHMYTSSDFLKESSRILKTEIDNSSIEDIEGKSTFFLEPEISTAHKVHDYSNHNINQNLLDTKEIFRRYSLETKAALNAINQQYSNSSYKKLKDELARSDAAIMSKILNHPKEILDQVKHLRELAAFESAKNILNSTSGMLVEHNYAQTDQITDQINKLNSECDLYLSPDKRESDEDQ